MKRTSALFFVMVGVTASSMVAYAESTPRGTLSRAQSNPLTDISFSLQFNADGVFPPQANPNTSYFSPPPDSIAERSAFPQVSGGLLKQRMHGLPQPNNGISRYQSYPGRMDSRLPFFMEVRLRTLSIGDDGHLCFFQRDDGVGSRNFEVDFTATGVELADGTRVSINHSVMHTYRIEAIGNTSTYRLLIDGQLAAVGVASTVTTGENAFAFGDSEPLGVGWDVDYDYVVFRQGADIAVPSVSPSGIAAIVTILMCIGALAAARTAVRS